MANRAYLYAASKDFSIMRDISENPSEVPLVYKILLGVNTKLEESKIWNYEQPIAISGDFSAGLAKLDAFYEFLKTQSEIDATKISEFQKNTKEFFEKNPERKLDLFYMEGGEVYDLVAFEDYTIEKENEYIYLLSMQISADIDEILQNRPANLFDLTERYTWLNDIQENLNSLEPYWTHVTYFSFNSSGKN